MTANPNNAMDTVPKISDSLHNLGPRYAKTLYRSMLSVMGIFNAHEMRWPPDAFVDRCTVMIIISLSRPI